MTSWLPDFARYRGPRYRAICAALAGDIREGKLAPGAQLPTHRELAWRLGVTIGTVTRAYTEARSAGLIVGEVGRGTFVRRPDGSWPEAPLGSEIDLSLNLVRSPIDAELAQSALRDLAENSELARLIDHQPAAGRAEDRAAGAAWFKRLGLKCPPEEVLVSAGGQHAMATALGTLVQPGEHVAVDALTYPGFRALANFLRLRVAPIALDEEGIIPEAFVAACQTLPIRALYTQPVLHNPMTGTLGIARREALADAARRFDVMLIEDDAASFLLPSPPPPLAHFAPERTVSLTSVTGCFLPAFRIGFIHAPPAHVDRMATAILAMTFTVSPLTASIVSRWIADGTGDRIVNLKRKIVAERQAIARRLLGTLEFRGEPAAPHLWLTCPEPWHADDLARVAEAHKVVVTPASTFGIARQVPNAIRICLGTPPTATHLERGLAILVSLMKGPPPAHCRGSGRGYSAASTTAASAAPACMVAASTP